MQTNPAAEQNKTLNGLWVRGISPIGKEKVYGGNDLLLLLLLIIIIIIILIIIWHRPMLSELQNHTVGQKSSILLLQRFYPLLKI